MEYTQSNVAAPREKTGMRRALCLLGVAAVVCWVAAPSSRSADGFATTDVQGFLAAIPASFTARAPTPAMNTKDFQSVRQAGYVGHVGQWGPQPVNQGAVFGRRPQEPEEHPGMQQSWASPVITGPGAPASPIRGQSQDLEMQSAWAAGTVSARDAPLTNAQHSGASGVTGPSAPIPASQEEAAKAAWLTKNGGSGTRDAAPNVASDPASPWGRAGGSAWYGGQVAAGPATRHTTPGDGQMHAAWGALNVQNRGGVPQSKFTENQMLGPGSNFYPR